MLRRARPLLGTYLRVSVCAGSEEREWRAADAAFAAVAEVQQRMSFHAEDSDVTRLNREAAAAPVEVDPLTYTVLCRARTLSRLSQGRFDCTVGGRRMQLGTLPRRAALPAPGASWRDVELLEGRRVRFRRPLAIDLGGIAKGFAVDRAVSALQRAGADSGCVDAGGDLRVFGDRDWPVAVRAPDAPLALRPLPPLRNRALATTADSFAPRRGRAARGHVVDPATGRSRARAVSVSVLAPTCMDADALTKVVWLSADPPLDLLEELDAHAIVFGPARSGADPAAPARRAAG